MQFEVPQFIEHEPKIIGPLTFNQFIYIGIAGAVIFLLFFSLPFALFLVPGIAIGAVGAGLAFLKVSGKSLPVLLLNLFSFSLGPKTYIWHRKLSIPKAVTPTTFVQEKKSPVASRIQSGKGGRIKDLSLRVDTK
jgi:hypothetical protein